MAASPFGAPAGGGGLFGSPFGAASTPGFGQAAPASPFGASSTPAFGAAASAPGFGFGQATAATGSSLFGGATAGAFGASAAAASPGLFGAASSPSFFGANSSPAFGASTAPGLFGAASASAFGAASSPSPFGASTPSMFGASTAPATGAGFGSLFGGASSTPSLFGGASAPATGGFGGFGGFGAQTQMAGASFSNPTLALQPAGAVVPQPIAADNAAKEIGEIKAAYTPGHPSYRFQHLLLNVVDHPAQRAKPANIDEMRWRQALASAGGPDNPDRLWPVPAMGFKDLLARNAAQVAALDENAARLKALQDLAFRLAKRQGSELKQRSVDVQQRHLELAARLLRLCRVLDALESRLAASVGFRGAEAARAREQQLSQQLAAVEGELAPGAITGLSRRLEAVSRASELQARNPVAVAAAEAVNMDERSSAQLHSVLKYHAEAIAKLQAQLKRDELDVAIMQQELLGSEDGMGRNGAMRLD